MKMKSKQPNIIFILSDDHAAAAISAYGSKINKTPNIDRLAYGGARMDHCYCTNSICTPSRAAILTGQHAHVNGVRTLQDKLDGTRPILLQKLLQEANYQTAVIGKWHLGHGGNADPTGFDYWNILPGQGHYHNPDFIRMGEKITYPGYVSEIITDLSLEWLNQRDPERPFLLMCHHKAPHRPWEPAEKYANLYDDLEVPEPETFHDDYSNRSRAAAEAKMRIDRDMTPQDLKGEPPPGLDPLEQKKWKYQRYIKDYLRCCASIDDSVGQLLDFLHRENLEEDTIVVYTSDQGFFLGEHGWFDKRFMYEESFQMPFLIRYPREIPAGSVRTEMMSNVDFAPTLLDMVGVGIPSEMQGKSARPVLQGQASEDWQKAVYYRYWMHRDSSHNVISHYGIKTHDHKLIYYYGKGLGCLGASEEDSEPEWELFDHRTDPLEMNNVYGLPEYAATVERLTRELDLLQERFGDKPEH